MSGAKRLSNINTIMDKVKKGEVSVGSSFSFSNVQFARKREVIQPYLHWLDEKALSRSLSAYFTDDSTIHRTVSKICQKRGINADPAALTRLIISAFKQGSLPEHFIRDLFNFYYLGSRSIEFAEKKPYNVLSYKMLERLNNPIMKILTNHYPLKSMVMIRSLILQLLFGYALRKLRNDPGAASLFKQFKISLNIPMDVKFDPDDQSNGSQRSSSEIVINVQMPSRPNSSQPSAGNQQAGQKDKNSSDSSDSSGQNQSSNSSSQADGSGSTSDTQSADQNESSGNEPDSGNEFDETPEEDFDDDNEFSDTGDEDPDGDQDDDFDDDFDDEFDEDLEGDDEDSDYDDPDPDMTPDENPAEVEGGQSSGGGGAGKNGVGTRKSLETQLEDLVNQALGQKEVLEFGEEIVDEAKEVMSSMGKIMNEEEIQNVWESFAENFSGDIWEELNKTDKGYLDGIYDELKKIQVNMTGVKQTIKKLLDKSVSYFSARETPYFEPLFDADSLSGLQDYELLHPKIRKIFADDVMVKNTRKAGKIDVYVDISDSMNMASGLVDDSRKKITKAAFAKAILLKLKELDMLDELYVFENTVRKKGNSVIDVLSVGGHGGTSIDNVLKKIKKTGKNSLIITDAQDYCGIYDERAYFLGVYGAEFNRFSEEVRKLYAKNDQWCIFDGNRIYKVNVNGRPVK
jgi:hypothetical protein